MPVTKLKRYKITQCDESNDVFIQLFCIFTATLHRGMAFKQFRAFYHSQHLDYIDATFIYSGEKVIGFFTAAFYKTTMDKRPLIIARAATGILPEERGARLPYRSLYSRFMVYKLMHPFTKVLLTVYVANPLMYAMICKYTGIVYPFLTVDVSGKIQELKSAILLNSGLNNKEILPFVVKIHFDVQLGTDTLKRIVESNDVFVKYYLSINPKFQEQYGVLTIVPVTWQNVLHSSAKLFKSYHFNTLKQGHTTQQTASADDYKNKGRQRIFTNFQKKKSHKEYVDGLPPDADK